MERLGDAYRDRRVGERDRWRVTAGVVLFAAGALGLVAALLSATTGLPAAVGVRTTVGARTLAGLLAGLGVPAALAGVVVVLPADRRERLGVLAGVGLSVVGVALFVRAYPTRWIGDPNSLAFLVAVTYLLGAATALWFVLTAVADFRRRNDPAGTVRLEVSRRGETRTVELDRSEYRRYRRAARGDGGRSDQVVEELESRFED
jgi:MFS family permease